ncbi:hypothetical protein O181_083464 [Austropuccinia psidii MF-1]|uniref:Uncharacterized protein n=1 Tax=Austropuccinia psidii MF-1 TaxID=1389203 RepID=A0A9Q3FR87_9BASI|nr:hypothetical protein [Austropuccinia psidii MF-1]
MPEGKNKAWEEVWTTPKCRDSQAPMGNHKSLLGNRTCPRGKENHNTCLVIVYRFRKSVRCLPCHKEDTGMNTELKEQLLNKVLVPYDVFGETTNDITPNGVR